MFATSVLSKSGVQKNVPCRVVLPGKNVAVRAFRRPVSAPSGIRQSVVVKALTGAGTEEKKEVKKEKEGLNVGNMFSKMPFQGGTGTTKKAPAPKKEKKKVDMDALTKEKVDKYNERIAAKKAMNEKMKAERDAKAKKMMAESMERRRIIEKKAMAMRDLRSKRKADGQKKIVDVINKKGLPKIVAYRFGGTPLTERATKFRTQLDAEGYKAAIKEKQALVAAAKVEADEAAAALEATRKAIADLKMVQNKTDDQMDQKYALNRQLKADKKVEARKRSTLNILQRNVDKTVTMLETTQRKDAEKASQAQKLFKVLEDKKVFEDVEVKDEEGNVSMVKKEVTTPVEVTGKQPWQPWAMSKEASLNQTMKKQKISNLKAKLEECKETYKMMRLVEKGTGVFKSEEERMVEYTAYKADLKAIRAEIAAVNKGK